MRTLHRARVLPLLFLCLASAGAAAPEKPGTIGGVQLGRPAFNPARGEKVEISYDLAKRDQVTVRVYDADGGLVRTLVDKQPRDAGRHTEAWDGKDLEGRLVPDEAYTFVIETASGAVYDPTTFSGGVVGDVAKLDYQREGGTLTYTLPAPARVLIRLGVRSGPMHRTLVDWKPRAGGSVTEYWDGWDDSRAFRLGADPGFTTLVTYATLPDATVIAFGNAKGEIYRDYKLGRAKARPARPARPRQAGKEPGLRPENLVPPAWARAPRVSLTFPKVKEQVPQVRGAVDVRVEVDPADLQTLLADRFEVIFYVDNVFFAEAERGYLPFNWRWEVDGLPPGEHLLTVNVSSFRGQVGTASRKAEVLAAP